MSTITDFQEWLDNLQETHIEVIYNLYESIVGVTQMGGFTSQQNAEGRIFVTTDENDQILMLASGKAVKAFLDKLDNEYGGGFGWVGGAYEFHRSMEKDD